MKARKVPATVIIAVFSLAANIILGALLFSKPALPIIPRSETPLPNSAQTDISDYPFLSKRIFAENQNDILINFSPLRSTMREYVNASADKIGVYFEYLPSGITIGVNDREEIRIVSLAKVPLAMAILKKIERGELSFDDTVTITEKHLDRNFGTLWQRGPGTTLSIKELLTLSLTESDNTAYRALFDQCAPQEINSIYEALDIKIEHTESDNQSLISPKNYSSILKSLYLSSILSKEHSHYLLQTLTQTTINNKISAGVPSNVPVAHKIGVLSQQLNTTESLFIDCGIVYIPNRPYSLCMFVYGSDEVAQKHMVTLSKMVYGYVSAIGRDR